MSMDRCRYPQIKGNVDGGARVRRPVRVANMAWQQNCVPSVVEDITPKVH